LRTGRVLPLCENIFRILETRSGGSTLARSGTQVLDRAIRILETIADHGRITLTELSEEIDLPLSTTQRILTSLASHGLVEQTKPGSGYGLGGRLQVFASQIDSGRNLLLFARPIMEKLAAQTQEDVFLASLNGRYATVIERVAGPQALKIVEPPGEVAITLNCGFRRVLLAYQPAHWIDDYIDTTAFPRYAEGTITDKRELRRVLRRVREIGYDESKSETVSGASGIAAPVFGPDGEIAASLFIVGPSFRFTKQHNAKLIGRVTAAARSLTSLLRGARPS
jgi:DNA-binding IclR family transcriptional regulator